VAVAVVRVGKMRVRMLHRFMAVAMGVRQARSEDQARLLRMGVLVVVIVCMFVLVVQWLVHMGMLVFLRQVQPNTQAHQKSCGCELRRDRFAAGQRQGRAEERSHGKVGASSCGPQVAQAYDKQGQAHAIGQKAHQHRA